MKFGTNFISLEATPSLYLLISCDFSSLNGSDANVYGGGGGVVTVALLH
jgi:hypothetical protein